MPKRIEAGLDAAGIRFAVIASRFNNAIVSRLIDGAVDCLIRHGADEGSITVVRVPGAFELPQAAQRIAAARKHDAIIALGVLVRGETPHFDVISSAVARGLSEAGVSTGVPVSFGLVNAENTEQAVERAGGKMGNRGWEAALSAIEMARLGGELG